MREFNLQIIGYINTFEKLTRTKVKDAFIDKNNQLVFIVEPGFAGMAIGKEGVNIKRLSKLLNKNIKVIEFNPDVKKFIKNITQHLEIKEITQENNTVNIVTNSTSVKASLIGRDRKNLKALQNLIDKYFKVEIKII